jgi:hypothetical protein
MAHAMVERLAEPSFDSLVGQFQAFTEMDLTLGESLAAQSLLSG